MIPYISKEINGNFNLKYNCRTTSSRRSIRNKNTKVATRQTSSKRRSIRNKDIEEANDLIVPLRVSTRSKTVDVVLNNYRRFYVEDYMTCALLG